MKYQFDLIKNIDLKNEFSWKGKIFLTFDVDWASDEVWNYCLKILEDHDIPATWFITHESPLINRILENENFDVGIHPNFNSLLENKNKNTAGKIIDDLRNLIPSTNILRSHSLFQSERFLDLFKEKGYTKIANAFLPLNKNQIIAPFKLWDDVIILPHCWQDNVSLKMKLNLPNVETLPQLIILNFHPIHVFLNTENLKRYENTRQYHQDFSELKKYINDGYGVRNILLEIIKKNYEKYRYNRKM